MAWELMKTEEALASLSSAPDLVPSLDNFSALLIDCRKAKNLAFANRAYAVTCNCGVESRDLIRNLIVPMFVDCGGLDFAHQIFRRYPVWNEHTWTSLIGGVNDQGNPNAAFLLYNQMEKVSIYPSRYTFVSLLKACAKMKCLERGQSLHASIAMEGFEQDSFLVSALVDMYGKCGCEVEAQDVFDSLPEPDVVCWTALITGYAQRGFREKASKALEQMQLAGISPDVILWNAVLLAYAEHGEYDLAFKQYTQMQEQGLLPNPVTYLNVLKACTNRAAIKVGMKLHAQIHRIASCNEGPLGTALIDMYGKCGNMADAEHIFDKWHMKSVITWNALITGYAHQGQFELLFDSFDKMGKQGVRPDVITLLVVLNVCCHGGFLEKARRYFRNMYSEYGIVPNIKHYNCMMDLLGRLGLLNEAVAMMEEMPYPPNYVTWSNLLAACQKWGDVELCRKAFEHAVKLKVEDARVFILMSNVYADVQKWHQGTETLEIHENER